MKKHQIIVYTVLISYVMLFLNSCVNSKKLRYFTTVPESGVTDIVKVPHENIIAPSDILYITIFSTDEVTNKILNSAGSTPGSSAGAGASAGGGAGSEYLVNDSGYIKLAVIGPLKVSGMKKEQLADSISRKLIRMKYVIDPMVIVRIVNFKITVLGEVAKPGVYTIPNEHVNITELIALAGDLTIYGNRANVLLIREKDGKRIYRRYDLNKIDLFNSDIYNLQNQDIIYVEPTKAKAQAIDRTQQTIAIILSSLTFIISTYTLATRTR